MNQEFIREMLSRFEEAMAQRLWDQWCAIGVRGRSTKSRDVSWVVDPESLLLASTRAFSFDPRLKDVAMDWVITNGEQVSLARLKGIAKNHGFADRVELSSFAETISENSPTAKQWKTLIEDSGEGVFRVQESAYHFRKNSRQPDPHSLACLLFKLRGLFGVNSRAEIILWLLANRSGHPAMIAKETGWFSKTVQKTLNELVLSGFFEVSQPGREKLVSLCLDDQKRFAIQDEVNWTVQPYLYDGLYKIYDSFTRCADSAPSERVAKMWIEEALSNAGRDFFVAKPVNYSSNYGPVELKDELNEFVNRVNCSDNWPNALLHHNPHSTQFV